MYGLARKGRDEDGILERIRERREERDRERELRLARNMYPDLPIDEALDKYRRFKEGRKSGDETFREAWPIFLSVGAGLLIFTMMRR